MDRREFIKMCGLLGISVPLTSCKSDSGSNSTPSNSSGSVLIIGAGAAGLVAGYLLNQNGISFQILEASSTYGGRMKRTTTFADFPIPLGAEWLHASENELTKILKTSLWENSVELQGYTGQDRVGYFENGVLNLSPISDAFGSDFEDKKFINSTWFDFFEEYVAPSIQSQITFNTQVVSIDYTGDKVIVTDHNGLLYEADKVIVTVPLKILQNEVISFSPSLPYSKLNAIREAPVWGGIKVFIRFAERFYPTYLTFPDSETSAGQRAYFDAAYGQNTSLNVLGLFAVGQQARQYQLVSQEAQLEYILNELNQVFDGKASQNYINHVVQNWDDEPYIHSAYLADIAPSSISSALSSTIDHKLYFAGDSYTQEEDWGAVHNATQSARRVVEEILKP
ncbi:NAD(P)/FAD-dependent oxidoreductase [Pseudoalteromonas sp. PPB1]|uniref:flavin monoamine oxidase family protein n=1 Tax=Pseudoalteromonas sp. PPB1 TaxID=2756136 RepID=UPI002B276EED|nr:NAD(P)/FAD-dependent oxidoreductase [Pseudoalteromonas sp. PPB1]